MKKFTSEAEQNKYVVTKTIIGISSLIIFLTVCVLIFKWINNQPNTAQGQKEPLTKILNANEDVINLFYSNNYVGFITPDNQYYFGIDMKSALHPQTILCYELKGQTLPMVQGYLLRLIIPFKYGIKNIKRIGTIFFSDTRPKD